MTENFIPIRQPKDIEVVEGELPLMKGTSGKLKYPKILKGIIELADSFQQGEESHVFISIDEDDPAEWERVRGSYVSSARWFFNRRYKDRLSFFANVKLQTRSLADGSGIICRLIPEK